MSQKRHKGLGHEGLPLFSWLMLMDLSLIWSSLGLMSRHGLFPIPMEDISCSLMVLLRSA